MRTRLIPKRIADDILELNVSTPAIAQAIANKLRCTNVAEDVVAGLSCVAIRFSPNQREDVEALLSTVEEMSAPETPGEEAVEIDVQYGGEYGPDLEWICTSLKQSQDEFITLHTRRVHTVEMMGFTPGFSYISGLPNSVKIPRLDEPRPRVPAGSVGVSSDFTGLYALAGPGGWPLIGRTQKPLFCPDADEPFKLKPGLRIRFRAV